LFARAVSTSPLYTGNPVAICVSTALVASSLSVTPADAAINSDDASPNACEYRSRTSGCSSPPAMNADAAAASATDRAP
jgi:hypothetical protein